MDLAFGLLAIGFLINVFAKSPKAPKVSAAFKAVGCLWASYAFLNLGMALQGIGNSLG